MASPGKRTRKRQGGSALIPTMIGFGAVALTATVVTNLLTTAKRSAVTSAQNAQFQLLQGQLKSILEQDKSCRTALGGPASGYNPHTGAGGTPVAPQTLNTAANAATNIRIYREGGVVFLDPAGTAAQKTFGDLLVTQLQLITGSVISANDSLTYRTHLLVTVQKPAAALGTPVLSNRTGTSTTTLPLNVRLNGSGQIIACSGLSLVDGSKPLPVCLSDQGLTVDNTGAFTCVKVTCPIDLERSLVWPFKANGDINCVWGGYP